MSYLSDFLGGPQGTASASFTAGETVTAGQLAVIGADGLTYFGLDPNGPNAAMRPIAQIVAQNFPVTQPFTTVGSADYAGSFPYSQARIDTAVLNNGNFVIVWQDASTNNIVFQVFTGLGVSVAGPTTVGAGQNASDAWASVTAIPSGGFIIAWVSLITTVYGVKFATYSNTGAAVIVTTAVDSETTNGYSSLFVSILTNGSFAFCYYTLWTASGASATSTAYYSVYSSAGALVIGSTVLGANTVGSSNGGNLVTTCTLSGGGYVAVYALFVSGNNWAISFQRFNNTGILQGSITSVVASVMIPVLYATALTGGGFMLTVISEATNQSTVYSYTATGTLNTSTLLSASVVTMFAGTATADGGYAYVMATGTPSTLTSGKLSATGAVLGSALTLTTNALVGSGGASTSLTQLSTGALLAPNGCISKYREHGNHDSCNTYWNGCAIPLCLWGPAYPVDKLPDENSDAPNTDSDIRGQRHRVRVRDCPDRLAKVFPAWRILDEFNSRKSGHCSIPRSGYLDDRIRIAVCI
jgi:hypothetical protein